MAGAYGHYGPAIEPDPWPRAMSLDGDFMDINIWIYFLPSWVEVKKMSFEMFFFHIWPSSEKPSVGKVNLFESAFEGSWVVRSYISDFDFSYPRYCFKTKNGNKWPCRFQEVVKHVKLFMIDKKCAYEWQNTKTNIIW